MSFTSESMEETKEAQDHKRISKLILFNKSKSSKKITILTTGNTSFTNIPPTNVFGLP